MRPFKPKNHITFFGIFSLICGSIMLGIILGSLAYLISNFLYLILIFPIIIGFGAMIPFARLIKISKIRHSITTAFLGFLTGLIIAITFNTIPYLVFQDRYVDEIQQIYQIDTEVASLHLNSLLEEETGSRGLMGFLKLRAENGEIYSNYIMIGSIAFHLFDFSLPRPYFWAYLVVESLLFTLPLIWIGIEVGKSYFNESANDWYLDKKQIGEISVSNKEEFLLGFQMNSLDEAIMLMLPEGTLEHPKLEMYEQRSKRCSGDILISLFETSRKNLSTIKRTLVNQWEITQTEYARMLNKI